jgi:hypothetical protein
MHQCPNSDRSQSFGTPHAWSRFATRRSLNALRRRSPRRWFAIPHHSEQPRPQLGALRAPVEPLPQRGESLRDRLRGVFGVAYPPQCVPADGCVELSIDGLETFAALGDRLTHHAILLAGVAVHNRNMSGLGWSVSGRVAEPIQGGAESAAAANADQDPSADGRPLLAAPDPSLRGRSPILSPADAKSSPSTATVGY